MEWQLQWGDHLPQLLSSQGDDEELPPFLEKMPQLRFDLAWIVEAFYVLSGSRQIGMGVGAIPISEIEAYIHLYGLIDEDIDRFIKLIAAMDSAYVQHANRRNNGRDS